MYFREYLCRFSRKSHYFYILGVSHLKIKPCEISFTHKSILICKIVFKFRREHGNITAVLCSKFQNESMIEMDVLEERDFASFEFEMGFGRHPILQQSPSEFHIRVLTTAAVPHEHFYVPSPFSLCYTRLAILGGGSNLGRYGPQYHCATSLMKRLCFVLTHGIPVFYRWGTQTWSSSYLILHIPFPYIAMTS